MNEQTKGHIDKTGSLPGRGWSVASSYILDAPDPRERLSETARVAGFLFAAAGLLAILMTLLSSREMLAYPTGLATAGLIGVVIGFVLVSVPQLIKPWMLIPVAVIGTLNISAGIYSTGPVHMAYGAMLYPWVTGVAFLAARRRWSVVSLGLIAVCYALVLAIHQPPMAYAVWTFTVLTATVSGAMVSWLVQHGHELALAERAAKREAEEAGAIIARMNADLEQRVAEQVHEVERLGRLRTLLSPHLADAILSSDELSNPHRREIAVFFADLRGFTSFAAQAEPEEVVQVLEEFYEVVGELFARHEATVGDFAGDGVMAFFNDPLPVSQPALRAVEVALELRAPMAALLTRWNDCGFDLGYGVGISLGYATLGMVGFEARRDYMAVGSVVNLAARLCDEAKNAEVLVDKKAAAAVGGIEFESLTSVALKGFRERVPVFRVKGRKEPDTELRVVS